MGRVTLSFRTDQIRISSSVVLGEMKRPRYVHVLIDRGRQTMYIRSCKMDSDAYFVRYKTVESNTSVGLALCSKNLLMTLADVIGVPYPSESLRYGYSLVVGDTLKVSLKDYVVIPFEKESHDERDIEAEFRPSES